ncbi:MAG: bifunctional aminoglycoside phosphotransferase/ATP-binding protein [Alkalilacustris sp.]
MIDDILALLGDPATHDGAAVEVVRTHGALVFLAGPWAYKVKRPVRYAYLDFSTPERRRRMLAREIALNRPAAPDIYDKLLPLTREADGTLALDGTGPPCDWVLRMHRFPPEAQLSRIAARGPLDPALAAALGGAVAALHRAAPRGPGDGAARMGRAIDGLAAALAPLSGVLGDGGAAVLAGARAALARHAGLLDRRAAAGWVRRCHGDLHLGNLVVLDGGARPVPFDALEFDEGLATIDVLYDLAFLLMDLDRAGHRAAANIVLNRWLRDMPAPEHLDALALLPLFLGLRAAIRAMAAAQSARLDTRADDRRTEARAALRAAQGYLAPARPRLVAVGGLSGSGKSTLAADLAPAIGPAPGAVLLRSDQLRKALAGLQDTDRMPAEQYTRAASARVYAALRGRAARVLAAGHGAVLDAVHLGPDERAAVAALGARAGVRTDALWIDAPPDRLAARVRARQGDASDADATVLAAQIARAGPAPDWPRIDADAPPATVAARARAHLALPPAD